MTSSRSKTDKTNSGCQLLGTAYITSKYWNTQNYVSAHVPMSATHTVASGLECISIIIHKKHWHGRFFLLFWPDVHCTRCWVVWMWIWSLHASTLFCLISHNTQQLPPIVVTYGVSVAHCVPWPTVNCTYQFYISLVNLEEEQETEQQVKQWNGWSQLISTSRPNNNTHTDEHKDNLRPLTHTHTHTCLPRCVPSLFSCLSS